jgi:hypothetical protein
MKCFERVWQSKMTTGIIGLGAMSLASLANAQYPEELDPAPPPEAPTEEPSATEVAPIAPAPIAAEAPDAHAAEQGITSEATLTWGLFVDASYAYSTAHSGTPAAAHRAWETTSGDRLTNNGFNLGWLGLDVSYDAGEVGATGSLRFGSAVPVYHGGNKSDLGIENLTQAYVTWKPAADLKLDLGQFNTIYGAEVAESWKNLNYSRGGLYYAMQPFFHTGLRAAYAFSEEVTATALVVDGVNTIVDDNDKPSLGLQLGMTPSDAFGVTLGYLGALEPSSDADVFSHFFDLVATISAGSFKLVLNGDYTINQDGKTNADGSLDDASFFGVSAAAGYALCPMLGFALRYEYLSDSDNTLYASSVPAAEDVRVNTLTGTIDLKPVSGNSGLIIRWDNRYEFANEHVFFNKDSDPGKSWFASILGVVVTTGN